MVTVTEPPVAPPAVAALNGPTPPLVAEAERSAVAEPMTPAKRVDLNAWLNEAAAAGTEQAFATLFGLWGVDYSRLGGATACERAASAGLACLYERGSWAKLDRYNRPAVLELIGLDGQRHHVVVTALADTDVLLDMGGTPLEASRADVDPYWFGDFILLWKPPGANLPTLALGSRGGDVLWLREQLDRAEGRAPQPAPEPLFDEALRQRVQRFQRERGLTVDGMVGRQTLAHLQAVVSDPSIPSLRGAPDRVIHP